MKKIYYKGVPYEYKAVDIGEKRQYSLYENGILMHFVEEEELDKKSLVTMALESYYNSLKAAYKTAVLHG
jgi:hypothetical protein